MVVVARAEYRERRYFSSTACVCVYIHYRILSLRNDVLSTYLPFVRRIAARSSYSRNSVYTFVGVPYVPRSNSHPKNFRSFLSLSLENDVFRGFKQRPVRARARGMRNDRRERISNNLRAPFTCNTVYARPRHNNARRSFTYFG